MSDPCDEPSWSEDGRRLRRDRNRDAVTRAFLELVAEGDLRPGLVAVADRSGVSYRSVFRYFADQGELALTAFRRLFDHAADVAPLLVDVDAGLDERIAGLVDQRLLLHERVHGVARLFRSLAIEEPAIADELAMQRRAARCEIATLFGPELEHLTPDRRADLLAIVAAVASFDHLDLLVAEHELPVERVRRLLVSAISDQFAHHLDAVPTTCHHN